MAAFLIRLVVTLGVALTVTPAEPYALWKRFGPTTTVTPQTPKSLTIPQISSSNGTVAGAVLTSNTGNWGNCSACSYAYVWVATADPTNGPWTSVGDSTGSYTTPPDSTLSYAVSVIATNAVGTATSGSSLIWGPMVPLAPAPTAPPIISSNNGVTAGATLTSTTGGWNNCSSCSYAYQWASASVSTGPWTNVGTNSASYTTPVGSTLYYSSTVTATNIGGSVPSAQSAAFGPMTGSSSPPVNTGAPTITSGNGTNAGTATLNSSTGGWNNCSPCTYVYQWYQGATSATTSMTAISGATTNTYQTQFSDATKYISVTATATGNGSSVTSPRAVAFGPLTSGSPPAAPPSLVSAPTITPTPTTTRQGPGNSYGVPSGTWVGNTITANNGTWSNCPCTFTYQWYKDGQVLSGATGQTLAVQSGTASTAAPPSGWQGGITLLAYVTATNALGSAVEATEVEPIVQTADWQIATPPTLVKCTDASFACTTTATIGPGTNLATGDFIKLIDGTISGTGASFATGFDYQWQRDPSGQAPPVGIEAWKYVGSSAPVNASWLAGVATYTMTGPTVSSLYIWPNGIVSISGFTPASNQYNGILTNVLGTTVSGGQVSAFTVGKGTDPGGNMTGGSVSFPRSNVRQLEAGSMTLGGDQDGNQKGIQNFSVSTPVGTGRTNMQTMPVGPIVAPGGTLSPPANTAIPTIASWPANGTSKVGFILYSGTPNVAQPGNWTNLPWNFTYQWFYCTSACSNPNPGQLLTGTLIPGATQGPKYYPLSGRDIGHQIFYRATAYNSAGTTAQDSAPTAVISLPDVPTPPLNPPVIVGPVVYGSADGGLTNYGSTVLVNGYGTWGGYPTSYTYQWYSCPTSTPSCTTPATGATGTYNDGLGWFPYYNIVAADMGNVISMDVIGSNAAAPQGVHARSSPTAVVSTFTPSPALPAGKLGVYPAGQDPLTPSGCTPIPAMPYSGGRDWYVDNGPGGSTPIAGQGNGQYGGGSYAGGVAGTADGTSLHPFNSLKAMFTGGNSFQQPGYGYPLVSTVTYNHGAPGSWTGQRPTTDPIASDWVPSSPKANRINPGDRIIVKQGNGSYGILNLFGAISNVNYPESNVDASGNTKFIQVAPDTGALPVVDRVSFGGRGWIVNGLRIGNTTAGTAYVALNGNDTIVTNSVIGAYSSLSSALADYNAKCIPASLGGTGSSCSYANFNSFLVGAMSSTGTLNGHCNALTNSKIWFVAGGPSIIYPQTNGLLEGNDIAYANTDFEDVTSAGPAIWHMEYIHDPIIPTTHPDVNQTQPVSNSAFYPGIGLIYDSNRAITTVDQNLLAINDPKYCASINKPNNCTDLILAGDLQCFQGSGAPHTGIRYVNNLCYATGHAGIPGNLDTIANNNFVTGGFQTPIGLETQYMRASYVANNVGMAITCGPNSTYKNNFVIPSGSTNGTAAGCTTGVTANPTGGGSAFTSYTPVNAQGSSSLVYPWTTSNDLRPSSAAPAILLGTGLAGTGAPTTTAERPETCSTFQGNCAAQGTRATPPNVGMY